jgi:hypothetical protein
MTSYPSAQPSAVVPSALDTAREQISIARVEIVLGAQRLLAQQAPSLEDARLMAQAILEFFGAQDALAVAETEDANVSRSR